MKVKMPKGTKCMANGGTTGDPTPRKVSTVPQGYQPYKKEGNRQLYYTEKQIEQAQKSGNQGGPEYENFLKKQLSSGVSPEQLAQKGYIDKSKIETYRPYHTKDIVYTEPEPTQPQKTPIPLDVDTQINRKDVSNPTAKYKSYELPDVNAGYSKSTTVHVDPTTKRKIDPIKSFDANGNYSPSYLYPEGDPQGNLEQGTIRNRSLSSGSIVKDPNYKADTKNAVVNTAGEFASGGKIPKKKGWRQYLEVGGDVVNQNGQIPRDINGNPITSGTNQLNTGGTEFKTTGDYSATMKDGSTSNIPNTNTTDPAKNKGAGMANKVSAGMGWFQYANAAQKWGRGINDAGISDSNKITDPNTGQVYTKRTAENQALETQMKPVHENVANVLKGNDNRQKALLMLDPGGNVSNYIDWSNPNKIGFRKPGSNPEFDAVKGKIYAKQNEENSMNARDAGQVGVVSRSHMAEGGGVNFKSSAAYKKWLAYGHIHKVFENTPGNEDVSIRGKEKDVQHKTEGGDIKGKGTAKSDSIPSKLAPGGFVVPAENADKAQELRDKYFPGTKGKADLKQKGGSPVMVSNGEHYFTPEECATLKKKGVDLDDLAPNADDSKGKKKGGDVDSMLDSYNTNFLNKRIKEVGREKAIKEYNDVFNND